MKRVQRVLLLVHPHFRPDRRRAAEGTERDVWHALRRLGFQVQVAGVDSDLRQLDRELAEFRPHIAFNLLEEFRGEAVYDFQPVSHLEALGLPYTGCNPRGLIQSRNKFIAGHVAAALGTFVPKSVLVPAGQARLPAELPPFPVFAKLNREHASLGIRDSNRAAGLVKLRHTCRRLRDDFRSEILIQEFIPGQDVSVGVWGGRRAEALPPRLLHSGGKLATARLKFSRAYQRRLAVRSVRFSGPLVARVRDESVRVFSALDMSGYARLDFRLGNDGIPYLIDVNPNPNLAKNEDFALALKSLGWNYLEIISEIIRLGFSYRPRI